MLSIWTRGRRTGYQLVRLIYKGKMSAVLICSGVDAYQCLVKHQLADGTVVSPLCHRCVTVVSP